MPFSGTGVYNAPSSPGAFNPALSGQQATPDAWDTLLADLQVGLSTMICRDGQSTVTGDIPFGGFKLTNVADGVANTDATTLEQVTALIAAAVSGVAVPTGAIWDYAFAAAPTGWIYCTGTIGNAASGATYANANALALFTGFYTGYNNTICPVSGGRGADAPTDFAAGKTIAIFDTRGAVRAAPDAMGGSARNVLGTGVAPGFTGSATAGAFAGAQSDTLDTTKIAPHSHGVTDPGHAHNVGSSFQGVGTNGSGSEINAETPPGPTATDVQTTGISIQNTGGGLAHNNTQFTLVVGCTIIKL